MVVRRTGKCLQGGGRDWFTEPQKAREGVGGTGGDKDRLAMLWMLASSRSHVSKVVELIIEPPVVGGCEVATG